MKTIFILTTLVGFVSSFSFAQMDTSLVYFSRDGRETTVDSAFTFIKMYKEENLWHGKEYFTRNKLLRSEGNYATMNYKTPVGSFDNYREDGSLDFKASYENGKLLERTYYYKNGDKKSHIVYSGKGVSEQTGWDEQGKEIRGYIVEQEARFKGGAEGWQKYLIKHLNSNLAVDAGAPAGDYPVLVEFLVSKEGFISNVKAVAIPAKCKPCAAEAVAVIANGPEWEPAIQNNLPVIYRQRQMITLQVSEGRKKRNKD